MANESRAENPASGSSRSSWRPRPLILTGLLVAVAIGPDARAQVPSGAPLGGVEAGVTCEWTPFFGGLPGVDHDREVRDSVVFDDGGGPALFLGGTFTVAGSAAAAGVARWDGESWTALGDGLGDGGYAYAVTVFDDGTGPSLYVGGLFDSAGGQPAANIARWDGSAWSPLGDGVDGRVWDLAVHDDGSGPRLFAAGDFTTAGGAPAVRLAAWDGNSWAPVGDGLDASARALAVLDSGSGPELIVAGLFTASGAQPLPGLMAAWDGAGFSPLGTGVSGAVTAMTVHDDGSGPKLWVSGGFGTAGGIGGADKYAVWDGASWSILPSTPDGKATALFSYQLLGQQVLVAGGVIGSPGVGVVFWDGATWQGLGPPGLGNGRVYSFSAFDFGMSERLVAVGDFEYHGLLEDTFLGMAVLEGGEWTEVDTGMASQFDTQVYDAEVFDDGAGPALFLAGLFTKVGGELVYNILRWDGSTVTDVGGGLDDTPSWGFATSLAVFDDGSGPQLYAGGRFNRAGGQPIDGIARWDGTSWTDVEISIDDSYVTALAVWDDGSGEKLYMGNNSNVDGGYLRCWDGVTWSVLGGDLNGFVADLLVHDDGLGEKLWVAGGFSQAGGMPVDGVATWDGTQWAAVGTPGEGPDGQVGSMTVVDLGSGPELILAGDFGSPGPGVVRWDGTSWIAMPDPGGSVRDVAAWDSGAGKGAELYLGGRFGDWQNDPTTNVLSRWTGSAWEAVPGLGASGNGGDVSAQSIMPIEFDNGAELLVSGSFLATTPGDSHLARLTSCEVPSAWTDLGSALAGVSGDPLLVGLGTLASGSSNALDLSHTAPSATAALFIALASTPLPFKGGTLLPSPFLPPTYASTLPDGTLPLPFVMTPGVPAGTEIWVQWAIQDTAAIYGVSLSNAIMGVTP
ncbi:MAG: hypothetical protein H6825_12880 [Planctomycetes bacterium]|nr:hypothetical protein [Planctomycetota bacterium]